MFIFLLQRTEDGQGKAVKFLDRPFKWSQINPTGHWALFVTPSWSCEWSSPRIWWQQASSTSHVQVDKLNLWKHSNVSLSKAGLCNQSKKGHWLVGHDMTFVLFDVNRLNGSSHISYFLQTQYILCLHCISTLLPQKAFCTVYSSSSPFAPPPPSPCHLTLFHPCPLIG